MKSKGDIERESVMTNSHNEANVAAMHVQETVRIQHFVLPEPESTVLVARIL